MYPGYTSVQLTWIMQQIRNCSTALSRLLCSITQTSPAPNPFASNALAHSRFAVAPDYATDLACLDCAPLPQHRRLILPSDDPHSPIRAPPGHGPRPDAPQAAVALRSKRKVALSRHPRVGIRLGFAARHGAASTQSESMPACHPRITFPLARLLPPPKNKERPTGAPFVVRCRLSCPSRFRT